MTTTTNNAARTLVALGDSPAGATGPSPLFRGKSVDPGPYYHGTSTALGIKGEILPPKVTGKQTEPRRQRRGKVFFTNSVESARIYAQRAVKKWGGDPVVYRITPIGPLKQISRRGSLGPAFHASGATVDRI